MTKEQRKTLHDLLDAVLDSCKHLDLEFDTDRNKIDLALWYANDLGHFDYKDILDDVSFEDTAKIKEAIISI